MEALRQNKAFSDNDRKRGDINGEESLYFNLSKRTNFD